IRPPRSSSLWSACLLWPLPLPWLLPCASPMLGKAISSSPHVVALKIRFSITPPPQVPCSCWFNNTAKSRLLDCTIGNVPLALHVRFGTRQKAFSLGDIIRLRAQMLDRISHTAEWLLGPEAPAESPRTHLLPRWIFLRALGVIYFSAFYSLLFQIKGMIGPHGILPAASYLSDLANYYPGLQRF